MSKRVKDIFRRSQRGFTLIELVAVMAILAILVAIVAPAVTDTRDASITAQGQSDSKQVNNLAAEFFGDQNEAEVVTPHSVTVPALTSVTGTPQRISNRWPEKFITHALTSTLGAYSTEFDAGAGPDKVVLVTLKDSENVTLANQAALLTQFTAVDFVKLGGDTPSTAGLTSIVTLSGTAAGTVEVHNFLWLLEKSTSGSGLDDDVRKAALFQLTGTEINENLGTVDLTYKRIL